MKYIKWLLVFVLSFIVLSAYGQQSHSEKNIDGLWYYIGYIKGKEYIRTESMSMEDAEYILVNNKGSCQVYAKGFMNNKPIVVYQYSYWFYEKENKVLYVMNFPVSSTEAEEIQFVNDDLIVMQFGDFSFPFVFQRGVLKPIND